MKNEDRWMKNYELLKNYYKIHGNIDVPRLYSVDGFHLGRWLNTQRQAYNKKGKYKITEKQIRLLNELGMKWNTRIEKWEECYQLLENYYEKHGNINISNLYKIHGINLGMWLNTQRKAYNGKVTYKITKNQIKLLNAINIDWSINDTKFLNDMITIENKEKYDKILGNRFNHILEDLMYEGFNDLCDHQSQKELESIIVKRLWR